MTRRAYALGFGAYFGLTQTCYFFQLEILLTAAYTGYITATLGWIAGAMAGLYAPMGAPAEGGHARPLFLWHIAGLLAYYASLALLSLFPYNFSLLPAYFALIMVSGAQAGSFFAINQRFFPEAASLFLWENNGFILGWIAGFFGFVAFGFHFNLAGPALAALAVTPLLALHARGAGAISTQSPQS